ncbi:MAG: hypothetical protein ABI867_05055 [Kofleriaceae bacterium]
MRRLLVIIACSGLVSCNFAVKHPAVTAGIVAGTLGLGSCELASSDHQACFAISGGAGVALALITAVALWIGYEDDTSPAPAGDDPNNPGVDPTNLPPARVKLPRELEPATPPPAPIDAGVPTIDAAPPADAAP